MARTRRSWANRIPRSWAARASCSNVANAFSRRPISKRPRSRSRRPDEEPDSAEQQELRSQLSSLQQNLRDWHTLCSPIHFRFHIRGLKALGPLGDLELHCLPRAQRTISLGLNHRVMDEDVILILPIPHNKAVPPGIVEPFHLSSFHELLLPATKMHRRLSRFMELQSYSLVSTSFPGRALVLRLIIASAGLLVTIPCARSRVSSSYLPFPSRSPASMRLASNTGRQAACE